MWKPYIFIKHLCVLGSGAEKKRVGLVLVLEPVTVLLVKPCGHPRGCVQRLEGLEGGGIRLGFEDRVSLLGHL